LLREIDEMRNRLLATPAPPAPILRLWEREYNIDHVFHGLHMDGGTMTREQVYRTLYPDATTLEVHNPKAALERAIAECDQQEIALWVKEMEEERRG
jgi:hypothetical protein